MQTDIVAISVAFSKNLDRDPRVTFMAVNSGLGFWIKSLFNGRFSNMPAIRLMGKAGKRRKGTDGEIANWMKRVRVFKHLKGHDILWKDIKYVRDIYFNAFEFVKMGKMTRGF